MSRRAVLAVAVLLAGMPASSPARPTATAGPGAPALRVAEVIDGGTLVLADGRHVRLTGIEAPDGTAPFAGAARDALAGLALGRAVTLAPPAASQDRYGRLVAHLHRDDGLWIQGALVAGGFARVRTRPDDDRARTDALLEAEAKARAGRIGLWRLDAYRVRAASGPIAPTDAFHLVEGTVAAVGRRRDRIFLNFGKDWRTDFTATVGRRALRELQKAGLDPFQWEGRNLRLRGWLFDRNGPMIELTHAAQVEFLD